MPRAAATKGSTVDGLTALTDNHRMHRLSWIGILALFAATSGCMSAYRQTLGDDTEQVFNRIYLTDFNTAWQSALDSLKNSRLDISNREGGFLQTRWTDNTSDKNFTDSFGNADAYLKAQYRVRVTVAKGFYNGSPSVKVSVQKEQLVQRDVLDGWKPVETDSVDEKTLLYRIGRLIYIRTRLAALEAKKTNSELQSSGLAPDPGQSSDTSPPVESSAPPLTDAPPGPPPADNSAVPELNP